jgi:hypothetical protein
MTSAPAIRFIVLLLPSLLVGGACGDDDSARVTEVTDAATSTTAAAVGSASTELQASWRTTLDTGEAVTLLLRADSYRITRGPASGTGKIAVDGDVITFSNSILCDGIGTYQWSLEGDMLTLTLTGGDPCSGRTEVLAGQTFVRSP